MSMSYQLRLSESPYVESITHGYTLSEGRTIRPAEMSWHMVLRKFEGKNDLLLVGPLPKSGLVTYGEGAELLWIKFRVGTFLSHLPPKNLLNCETILPEASGNNFWLKGSAWELPDYENVDTFVNRLVRENILTHDPLVTAALEEDQPPLEVASRTVRHRFLHAAGLPQNHIRQMRRAQHAAMLLQQGVSILDTVFEAGYFDQPHLTRSLKQFIGYTPAQLIRMRQWVLD